MRHRRFTRFLSALLVVSLLLMSGTAFAVVIQAGKPDPTGADLALFEKVKAYLSQQFKDCKKCQFVLVIQTGHVTISGVAPYGSLPHLRKIGVAVPGVTGVNLEKVQFDPDPQPHPRPLR